MGLIFSILMLGLVASLSPATIVVFIVVLATTRARVNAAAFLSGWAVSLTIVFTIGYLAGSSRSTQQGSGRTGLLGVEVLVGCALVAAGVRQWRRHGTASKAPDGWSAHLLTGRLDDLRPRGAALVGVFKQPWAITTAAAVVVAHHHEPRIVTLIAFACFTVASTASVGLMYFYYWRRPREAETYLAELRDRAIASGPAVFGAAAVVVGAFLVLDAVIALTGS
jgi:energy-coupling factor transporter transmembrane protein EcfT